jgi:hypothetical protein
MQRRRPDSRIGLRLEAHGDALNRDIVTAIGSVWHKLSPNPRSIQRSFKRKLKSVFAQRLAAKCMVYAEGVA